MTGFLHPFICPSFRYWPALSIWWPDIWICKMLFCFKPLFELNSIPKLTPAYRQNICVTVSYIFWVLLKWTAQKRFWIQRFLLCYRTHHGIYLRTDYLLWNIGCGSPLWYLRLSAVEEVWGRRMGGGESDTRFYSTSGPGVAPAGSKSHYSR